jgi:mannose-6-phosphate isomerase-like protein (cupin superfamily)
VDVKQLAAYTAFAEAKMAKHNLFQTERFFLDVYCLLPGQAQKPHAHEGSDKVYVVLEGRCRFVVGTEEAEHGPGSAVMAPAGMSHGVSNPGAEQARLLVFMAPSP